MKQWDKVFFFHFNKTHCSKDFPTSLGSGSREKHAPGPFFSHLLSWEFAFTAYLPSPWWKSCPEAAWKHGCFFQWCQSPWGWLCGKLKPSLPVRRAWSSTDGEESKFTHLWSSCFYIFRTDAYTWRKAPQFQNWFLFYFESHLPFPHPNSSKQDTEKHRK